MIAERLNFRTAYTPRTGTAAHFAIRDTTNDGALIAGIMGEDEYDFRKLPELEGWIIDIGAHIGIIAVGLALDHPKARVVAVEAIPANVDVLRQNVGMNHLEDRVYVMSAAASEDPGPIEVIYGWSRADNQPDAYMADNRYIGGMVGANETSQVAVCDALSLADILAQYEIHRVALLKIDCEGCEWSFLRSPEMGRCDRIIGEYHARPGVAGIEDIRALLPAHDVTHIRGENVGIFDAVLR